MNTAQPELCLYWLNPAAWDELEVEIIQAVPLDQWLQICRRFGYEVSVLAPEALIIGGPGDGGQVIAVDTPSRQYFIAPPAVIPHLADLIPANDFKLLLERTPAAAALVATATAVF
jgi:hypothetical protein